MMFHVEQKLREFEQLLTRVNQRINLVARTDMANVWERHILPCVAFADHSLCKSANQILDLGSGGGFPGIMLALCNPEAEVHLVESIQKKAEFLSRAARVLKLVNLRVHAQRIESYNATVPADLITARFFGELRFTIELGEHLLAEKGSFLLIKGDTDRALEQVGQFSLLGTTPIGAAKVCFQYSKTTGVKS